MTPISPALPPAQLQNSFNYEELQDKNGAAHIPFGEFRDLVNFARLYSPKMDEAIENGSLLTQTKFDLSERRLTELPRSLGYLISLTELNICGNELINIPESIGQLINLTELDIGSNNLTTLPTSIGELVNLTKFHLDNNLLETLPDTIDRLASLTDMDLSGNRFTTLPDAIGELANLTKIDLSSNQLTTLPNTVGLLKNLTYLEASDNQLSTLPKTVGDLTKLLQLKLKENELTTLPHTIGGLAKLEKLELSYNKLENLPEEIGHLPNLTSLIVCYNKLKTLPDTIELLKKLRSMDLKNNNLTTTPDAIGGLESLCELNLSFNQLVMLPETVGRLENLTTLVLQRNELKTFPPTIGQLKNLSAMNATHNQLTTLPPEICHLEKLNHLYVNNNSLTTLPTSMGDLSSLKKLGIAWNTKVTTLPLSLGKCTQLTHLDIEGTAIAQYDYNEIVAECRRARHLDSSPEKLLAKITMWKTSDDRGSESWPMPEFTQEQERSLYGWLTRLEGNECYQWGSKKLGERICNILKTICEDHEFREIFFNSIAADFIDSQKRASISFGLIYTEWRLHTLPVGAPLPDQLRLLVSCARTRQLRTQILTKYPTDEDVGQILDIENRLKEELDLITVSPYVFDLTIEPMPEDQLRALAQEIKSIPTAELVIGFDYWKRYLKKHHTSEFFRIVSRTQAALGGLLKRSECGEITDGEYREQEKGLQSQEENALLQLTKKIIDET